MVGAVVVAKFNLTEAASVTSDSRWCEGHRMDGRLTTEDDKCRIVRAKGFIKKIDGI